MARRRGRPARALVERRSPAPSSGAALAEAPARGLGKGALRAPRGRGPPKKLWRAAASGQQPPGASGAGPAGAAGPGPSRARARRLGARRASARCSAGASQPGAKSPLPGPLARSGQRRAPRREPARGASKGGWRRDAAKQELSGPGAGAKKARGGAPRESAAGGLPQAPGGLLEGGGGAAGPEEPERAAAEAAASAPPRLAASAWPLRPCFPAEGGAPEQEPLLASAAKTARPLAERPAVTRRWALARARLSARAAPLARPRLSSPLRARALGRAQRAELRHAREVAGRRAQGGCFEAPAGQRRGGGAPPRGGGRLLSLGAAPLSGLRSRA